MTPGSQKEGAGSGPEPGPSRYFFPRHPGEVNRLDLQHYALREALGSNYFAPVERPHRILDVGTGSGQWCLDMLAEFPQAFAVGLDLVVGRQVREPRFGFVRGDVTVGLPFTEKSFNFVHQRLLRAGIPVAAWPGVVADLLRITRPGGWLELVELTGKQTHEGPATAELFGCLLRLSAAQGLAPDDRVVSNLEYLLVEARLEEVGRHRFELPVGEWGGRPGSFLASNMRAMFTRLAPAFEARLSVPQSRTMELVRTAVGECEDLHTYANVVCAWGRRSA